MFHSVSHLGMIIFGVFNFREKKKANLYVIASLYEWNEEISGVLNNLSIRILSGLGIKWTEMNGVHYAYESVVLSFISFISELRRFTEQTLNRHCLVSVQLIYKQGFLCYKRSEAINLRQCIRAKHHSLTVDTYWSRIYKSVRRILKPVPNSELSGRQPWKIVGKRV